MKPVFVGGCPRSGTTLLGAMLGGHPDVLCPPESQFLVASLRSALTATGVDVDAAERAWSSDWRLKLWGDLSPPGPSGRALTFADLARRTVSTYAGSVGQPDPAIWVDHTPWNLQFAHLLLQEFPEARFLHIVRDGRAVAASLLPRDWGPATAWEAAGFWLERVALACC